MNDYTDKILWSKEVADQVIKEYKPYAVLVALTTGKDSNIALKLATMFFKVDAAFTCDTSIAAIETLKNCEHVAKSYQLKHICQAPRYGRIDNNKYTYESIVSQHGFPGRSKTAHSWMYKWLKDHTIQNIVSQFRNRKHNRPIVIISGARKYESVRRMGTAKTIQSIRNTIWVNIANEWTDEDVLDFTEEYNLEKYRSPISKIMGMSGECFCGCYAQKNELKELKFASPTTYDKIIRIQNYLHKNTNFQWGWEESPPKTVISERHRQLNLFSPQMLFCSTCMNNVG